MNYINLAHDIVNLIGQPSAQTTKAAARDVNGQSCKPRSIAAISWCLAGAADKLGAYDGAYGSDAIDDLLDIIGASSFAVAWDGYDNDTDTGVTNSTTRANLINLLRNI